MSTTRNKDSRDLFVMLCVRSVCAQHDFHQVSVFVGVNQSAVLNNIERMPRSFCHYLPQPLVRSRRLIQMACRDEIANGTQQHIRKISSLMHASSVIRHPSFISQSQRIHSMTVCFTTMMISRVIPIIYRLLYNMNTVMPTVLLCDRM